MVPEAGSRARAARCLMDIFTPSKNHKELRKESKGIT